MGPQQMQIGEVADGTGLSLRTIRYYEEVGLVRPSGRTTGGFRLYSDGDVERLRIIMRMKPLDFSLEEMKDVLDAMDTLADPSRGAEERERMTDRLRAFLDVAEARVQSLRAQLEAAGGFAADLRRELSQTGQAGSTR